MTQLQILLQGLNRLPACSLFSNAFNTIGQWLLASLSRKHETVPGQPDSVKILAHRHTTVGHRMVSQHTMVFISVFSLIHQATGTMGGHKSLYASGRKWLGKQIHAYTHTVLWYVSKWRDTQDLIVTYDWDSIETVICIFVSLCASLTLTDNQCVHTHTLMRTGNQTKALLCVVLECLTWWASSRSQGSFPPVADHRSRSTLWPSDLITLKTSGPKWG